MAELRPHVRDQEQAGWQLEGQFSEGWGVFQAGRVWSGIGSTGWCGGAVYVRQSLRSSKTAEDEVLLFSDEPGVSAVRRVRILVDCLVSGPFRVQPEVFALCCSRTVRRDFWDVQIRLGRSESEVRQRNDWIIGVERG